MKAFQEMREAEARLDRATTALRDAAVEAAGMLVGDHEAELCGVIAEFDEARAQYETQRGRTNPMDTKQQSLLLRRALPFLIQLGDFIGNGPVDAARLGSMGERCDLILDVINALGDEAEGGAQ